MTFMIQTQQSSYSIRHPCIINLHKLHPCILFAHR